MISLKSYQRYGTDFKELLIPNSTEQWLDLPLPSVGLISHLASHKYPGDLNMGGLDDSVLLFELPFSVFQDIFRYAKADAL